MTILHNNTYSQASILKGEYFYQWENNIIKKILLYPIIVIYSISFLALAIFNKFNFFIIGIIIIFINYFFTRTYINYKIQKHLQNTIFSYDFSWKELWSIDWNKEILLSTWYKKSLEKCKKNKLPRDFIELSLHYYKSKQIKEKSYFTELIVSTSSLILLLLNFRRDTDIENNYIWSVYIFLISLTTIFFNVINSIISNSKGIEVHNYRKMENLCEYLLQKLK